MLPNFNSITQLTHFFIQQFVKQQDWVVDATAGNGNDTLFLAGLVGAKGRVFAFDIQAQALSNTKQKLTAQDKLSQVTLIENSHEHMLQYVPKKVKAVMFNLGYLPNSSHKITTRAQSTVAALEKALQLLDEQGIISLVCYRGHLQSRTEYQMVHDYLSSLPEKQYKSAQYRMLNAATNSPVLFLVWKNSRPINRVTPPAAGDKKKK